MTKIISIANHKGGVGKTTTIASLGVALSMRGKKTLVVDLDSQKNLTTLFLEDDPQRTIFDAMIERRNLPIIQVRENLSLCPSSEDLINIDKALTTLVNDDSLELRILSLLLEPVKKEFDYILLDCPPSLGIMTRNGLVASDEVIITLTAEALPTKGLNSLMEAIDLAREGLNPKLSILGILITRYNRRKINRIVEEALRENFGDLVFRCKIRENVDIAESPLFNKDIFSYSPDSIGATDYLSLADEIISLHNTTL